MLYHQQSFSKNEKFKYEIYCMDSTSHYSGESYLSALNNEDAMRQFSEFLKEDKDNKNDSWGYCNPKATGIFTDELFFEKQIYYRG